MAHGNELADRIALKDALKRLAERGKSPVRASDLARETSSAGYKVPKKYVRRLLTENGDGVTAIDGVRVLQKPKNTFWFSLNETR